MPTTPSTGDQIGIDIGAVGAAVTPIISLVTPYGPFVELAFKALAVLEPAVYNAIVAVINKQPLTPEQAASMIAIEQKLSNPSQYYA